MKLPEQNVPTSESQDVGPYGEMQDMPPLLKVLVLTERQVAAGKVRPADEAFANIRRRLLSP